MATDEDTVLPGNVLDDNGNGIDDDPDGDLLTVTEVDGLTGDVGSQLTLASGALLTVEASGDFTYDPNGQFESLAVGDTATDAFDYTISDGIASDSAPVTVTINGVNDPPVASIDPRATAENAVLTASDADGTATVGDTSDDGVLVNDSDIDGDPLIVDRVEGSAGNVGNIATLASGATVTLAADGTFVYDPNDQFAGLDVGEQGSDTFSYRATDGSAASTASVNLTIDGVNDPPVAADDAFSTNEDEALTGNVLADNGSGPDGDPDDPLSVSNAGTLIATGLGGSVNLQANGDFAYTPPANASGIDTFDYTLADDNGATDTATVTITVAAVDDPPVAVDDTATLAEDASATAIDVLADDTDIDGGPIAIASVTQPADGTVAITGGGSGLNYAPDLDFCNGGAPTDDFNYALTPGGSTATVEVTVTCVNDAPTFTAADPAVVDEDAGPQFLPGWANFDPGPLESEQSVLGYTVSNVSDPALFSTQPSVDAAGSLTFTASADANGTSTFDVVVQDDGGTPNGGTDTSEAQTFTITVDAVNDQPTFAAADPAVVLEDAGAQSISNWATFDSGAANESQGVSAYTVSNVLVPSLFAAGPAIDASGKLTYTPAADANGTSPFDVVVQDDGGTANGGTDTSAPQTFTITVDPVNDAPTFGDGGDVLTFEDTPFDQPWAGAISAGPADESGQSITFLANPVTNPGLFQSGPSIDATGRLTFTPAADAIGTAEVDVVAMDDGGTPNGGDDTSEPVTLTVEVAKATDLAIAKTSGSFFTPPGGTLVYELVVTNPGPSAVVDARIEDPEPARLTFGNWQCAPVGLASCNTATGSGPVDVLVTIPEGDAVTVTVDAQLVDTDPVPVTNTATVTEPVDVTELAPADNNDSDTDAVGMFVDSFESVEPD